MADKSLHQKLIEEGFHKAIIPVKRTNTDKLINILRSYRGRFKTAIVEGSEIGARPRGFPRNLQSYYVVYVKNTMAQKRYSK